MDSTQAKVKRTAIARSWVAAVVLGALGIVACEGPPPEPVAEVTWQSPELEFPHGGVIEGQLTWQPLAGFPADSSDLFVFVHLLDAADEVVLTADHPLPPISGDAEVVDPVTLFHSALAPPLPAGDYRLTVGLYRPQGDRLALRGEDVGRQEYALATLTVPAVGNGLEVRYSDTWTPASEGADRQVRGLRWLTGPGTITVDSGSGELLMDLRLPAPSEGKELLFDEGQSEAQVDVIACDGVESRLAGLGTHRLVVPVQPGCEIQMTPNFYWVDVQTFVRSSLVLEQLVLR